MRKVFSVLAIVVAASVPASAQDLAVHVRGARLAPQSKEDAAALRAKAESAGKAFEERWEAAKKEFGKDAEKWPAATRDAVQAANETVRQAEADWFYVVELKQKDIDDSVADLEKALSERKGLRAAQEADADLVLEVVGRARVQGEGWGGQGAPESRLVFKARPGARLDVATLSKSAGSWDPSAGFWSKASTQTWHRLTVGEHYWLLMARKPGTGWMASYKGAAGEAAKAVEKFAMDNAASLTAARQAASR